VIRDIHREYVEAGARLHIVNSSALARCVLEPIQKIRGISLAWQRCNQFVAACEQLEKQC